MDRYRFSLNVERGFLLLPLLLVLASAPLSHAQTGQWTPERNVEIVVGTGPGSGPDITARLILKIWQEQRAVNAPLVVINKPGAGNVIAWNYLNEHAGDGHYLMVGNVNLSTGYLAGTSTLSYRDLSPVAMLFNEFTVFIVNGDSPMKTAADLIERLKADPTSVSLGVSTAIGGPNHLAGAIPLKEKGVEIKKMRTVAFRSGGQSVTALLGKHVDLVVVSPSVALPHIKSGKVRALAVLSSSRLRRDLADVPTWRELGVPSVLAKYRIMIGPKGMTREQIAFWEAQFARLSENEEWMKVIAENLWEAEYMKSRETLRYMEETHKQVEDAMSALGLLKQPSPR